MERELKKALAGTRAWDTYIAICIKTKESIAQKVSSFKRGDDMYVYSKEQNTRKLCKCI